MQDNLYFDLVKNGYQFSISIQSVVDCLYYAIDEKYFPEFECDLAKYVSDHFDETVENDREGFPTGKVIRDNNPSKPNLWFEFQYADIYVYLGIDTFVKCLLHAMLNHEIPLIDFSWYGRDWEKKEYA